ncbi:MAG: stage II sporulation protein M [Chloroflexi bacterium]|nr:stage II sporulation protein M [Chloroflexota bacterium]
MNLDTFLEQRQPGWQQLETLLDRTRKNIKGLSAQELATLGRLYQATTSDLALAQRDFPNHRVTLYLNQLIGRAHAHIYQGEPLRWRWLVDFYQQTFPRLYRALLPYTILSFGLFILPALLAFFLVWHNPDLIYLIEGPGIAGLVQKVEEGQMWTEIAPSVRSTASSVILTNNIQVTFLTFAGGITAGLFSAWIVLSNGLSIGAIFGLLQAHHMSGGLAEFVVAHGFIELSVIFMAGGCGLYLGDGVLRPGLQRRTEALIERGRLGVRMILGCVPLLVLAGLIEGFISPSGLPWPIKLAVGLITGGLLYYYWLRVGLEE